MSERIARLWCKRAHTRPMWPIHGRYICAQCLRQHPVAWDSSRVALESGVGDPSTFAGISHVSGAQSRRLVLMRQPGLCRENCVTFPGGR
jgi:hypothetical protein